MTSLLRKRRTRYRLILVVNRYGTNKYTPVCIKEILFATWQTGIMIQKIPKLKTPKIINLAKTTLFKENRADISNSFIPYMADFVLSAISSNARKGVNADTIHTVFSLAKEAAHATGKSINIDISHTLFLIKGIWLHINVLVLICLSLIHI